MSAHRKTVAVDFDGVLHAYTSGWQGAHVIAEPVPNAILGLRRLLPEFDVQIFSARNHQAGGIEAMRSWLALHGMTLAEIEMIGMPLAKPAAHLHIDDRAIRFNGDWLMYTPTIVREYRPWNK